MNLLKHVRDLRLEFRNGGVETALRRLKRFDIEPTLNIPFRLVGVTELEVMQSLMRAYSLRPRRVSFSSDMGTSVDPRLSAICNLSADSYNYWNEIASQSRKSEMPALGS
jgi:hypothetical protein